MATTISQHLVLLAEKAIKAGIKTGDEFAGYVRKNAPKLAESNVSYLYLTFRIVRKPEQYSAALSEIKKGSTESLSKLVKPGQKARGTSVSKPKARDRLDARLSAALGLDDADDTPAPRTRKRRPDPAPIIADSVFARMVDAAKAQAKKASK